MNLILWRHADAEDAHDSTHEGSHGDLARALTKRGRQQARQAAAWLDARLPDRFTVLASPATRAVETAAALTARYRTEPALAPGAGVAALLDAAGWPGGADTTVVVVGHQPTLGRVARFLMTGEEDDWSMRKSAVWWFTARERDDDAQVVLRAVIDGDWA